MDLRESILDPTNITRDMDTLILCFEGITGSGKSTLISDIKKRCRQIGRHHDLYIDRFSASLWIYGREIEECLALEDMVKTRAVYVYLTIDPDVAWSRESNAKKQTYKISEDTVRQTLDNFRNYFTHYCTLPVVTVDTTGKVDIDQLLARIEYVHVERMRGNLVNVFRL